MLSIAQVNGAIASTHPSGGKNMFLYGLGLALFIIAMDLLLWSFGLPNSITVKLFGIPTNFSILTLILIILFWADGNYYIREHQPNMSESAYQTASILVSVTVLLSVALHELGHGFVASLYGNPIDHAGFSWWGAFVSPAQEMTLNPWSQIFISLAGPVTNILIAGVMILLVIALGESLHENSIQYIGVINLRLARFNLLPLAILDGGHAVDGLLRLFIQDGTTRMILLIVIFILTIRLYRKYREMNPVSLEDRLATM